MTHALTHQEEQVLFVAIENLSNAQMICHVII